MPAEAGTRGRWEARAAARLRDIAAAGRTRRIRTFDAAGHRGCLEGVDGQVVSFASNDYFGLTGHPAVLSAAAEALGRWGAGAGAARLVVGARPVHAELEAEVAAWKSTEAALLFPTGFAANLGVLSAAAALAGGEATLVSDELNHASIIDGCRLARARVAVYRHRDVDHCARLLADTRRGTAVVVTDSVFSMDGDVAPVAALADVADRHGALLVVDEAHAALGPELHDLPGEVVRVGTLSKMLGALGGFVAGPATLVELLVNTARPFIFTTAPTPADTAAALAALRVLRSSEGDELRRRLAANVGRLAVDHPTPIVPVVVGDEDDAVRAADALLAEGFLVPAIRPPTVPPGTSRLRVAVSATHEPGELDALAGALARLGLGAGVAAPTGS